MIPSIPSLSSLFPAYWGPLASAFANHLWQSTLFAVVAALLTLALKNNHARTRYWLWFAASAKFLFPFLLLIVLGTHLAWLHPAAKPTAVASPATYLVMEEVSQPFDLATPPSPPPPPALSRTARLRNSLGGSFLPPALTFTWLSGFLFILVRWTARWWKIAAVLRQAPALSDGRESDALYRITQIAGLKRHIALKSLPIAIEPGIFGIFRPVLLWPEGISSHLDDAQLETILAHEVCHVRRRDNLTAALHMAVEAVFWFHPLVWWLRTRLIAEREAACDQDVLALCGPTSIYARAYAESILKVCEFSIVSPLPCISGVTGADLRHRIAAIVTARSITRLSWPRKILILAAALCVATAPVVLGMVKMVPLYGQILHADAPLPSFEVATIRPMQTMGLAAPAGIDPSKIVHAQEVHISSAPPFSDQINHLMTAKMLLADAYHLPVFSKAQIVGGPEWADQTMYQIKAKIGDEQYAALLKMPSEQQQTQVRLMEQSLLADRFQLRVHFETREVPVYALQVAKSGPKLTPVYIDSVPTESVPFKPPTPTSVLKMTGKGDGFEIQAKNVSPAQLILLLQQQPEVGNRLMVDKTSLTAKYDFTLDWTRQGTVAADASATVDAAPSFFTALKDQIGLELVETKAPIEVIVIDRIEKPTIDGAEIKPQAINTLSAPLVTQSLKAASPAVPQTSAVLPAAPPERDYRFEVASIRPGSPDGRILGSPGPAYTPGGFRQESTSIYGLAYIAFGKKQGFELEGPDWMYKTHFTVNATIPDGVTKADLPTMVRHLLEDRFGLRYHHVSRPMAGYDLVVAKSGLKIAKSNGPAPDPSAVNGNGLSFKDGLPQFDKNLTYMNMCAMNYCALHGHGRSMKDFAQDLAGRLRAPVIDATDLQGGYDYTVVFTDEFVFTPSGPQPVTDSADAPLAHPLLHEALKEQLGLEVKPVKDVPIDVVVLDSANKEPTEN